jgi:tRNA threonylcarbamoyladenosine biosynthesis protein TsaB
MKILAIETATVAGSIAITDDIEGLIGEVRIDVNIAHAERLMPSIEWLLKSSQLTINEIDAFALSIGPGSFTGLRIGLSTAKGLAFATGKPIIPVPTLDALARTLTYCSHLICPILDARKNEVYAALYKWEGTECEKVEQERAVDPEKLFDMINEPVVLMGDGTKKYKQLIIDKLGNNAIFAPPSRMSPSAATVAELAEEKFRNGITSDPVTLAPFYIRKSEAEINWKG